jgi:hypothetical protein
MAYNENVINSDKNDLNHHFVIIHFLHKMGFLSGMSVIMNDC